MDVRVVQDTLLVRPGKSVAGTGLGRFLEVQLHLPERFVRQLFAEDRVRIGQQPVHADTLLTTGQRLRLLGHIDQPPGVDVSSGTWSETYIDVLYEDEHILVVNKPPGLIIYPGDGTETDTLANRVARYYSETGQRRRVLHAHRLDKGTTGAVLYAKHGYSARALDTFLAQHKIQRSYLAFVQGAPQPKHGTVEASIGRDRHTSGRYRVSASGKPAITHYRTLATSAIANGVASLLACNLETGRTHQIRVHMASIGCPIVGDHLYGGGRGIGQIDWPVDAYALHARSIVFPHPYEDRDVEVVAPLPQFYAETLEHLGIALESV